MLLCSRSAAAPGPAAAAAAGSWRMASPEVGRCICSRCVMSRATGCTLPPAAEGDTDASSCVCRSCRCCWLCLPMLLLLLVRTMAEAPGLYPQLWLLLPLPCD
jgi:hypothetical protein